ncbi:hypothetical protein QBC46DRAFT_389503 [Diplogelasinospora grovesii]|uniref:Uncharacterized protein n=1 Tax=Diplogelasinospora grovesii TaxID=303347 RepID=A0AAN6N6N3_9PEZI|nr:hypothetical protein QBC46DRAFT_389503 [Diplogelasinospora grovesii]
MLSQYYGAPLDHYSTSTTSQYVPSSTAADMSMFTLAGSSTMNWASCAPNFESSNAWHPPPPTAGQYAPSTSQGDYFGPVTHVSSPSSPASPADMSSAGVVWDINDQPLYSPLSENTPATQYSPMHCQFTAGTLPSTSPIGGISGINPTIALPSKSARSTSSPSPPTSRSGSKAKIAAPSPPAQASKSKASSSSGSAKGKGKAKATASTKAVAKKADPKAKPGSPGSKKSIPATPALMTNVLEMAQESVKMLERERGVLQQQTKELQMNVGLIREAIEQQTMDLKEAVKRAENLRYL